MFIYKNWEHFCARIKELEIKTYTAADALSISSKDKKYMIIKHDVETNVRKALEIAEIENRFNIKTTFYVQSYLLNSNKNIRKLKKIQKLGHEVTYHYDVLDSNKGNWDLAISEFDSTIIKFKEKGFEITTVCPHGNPVMERNGWSSNKDFFRNIQIANTYPEISDIVINPEKFGTKKMSYISDAGYGWKIISDISNNDRQLEVTDVKIENLDELINLYLISDQKCFIVSSHPHRWRKYAVSVNLLKSLFFILRFIVRQLTKITLLNKFLSKYYYLAKKI